MATIPFFKMSGAGNDFVVIDVDDDVRRAIGDGREGQGVGELRRDGLLNDEW